MTSSDIDEILRRNFSNFDYLLSNIYLFGWESDFICMSSSEYWYEVEIKVSRSDFKADFKKTEKYFCFSRANKEIITIPGRAMENYFKVDDGESKWITIGNYIHVVENIIPHRFYYACPEGMIKKNEVPDYAGLFYCKEDNNRSVVGLKQVKAAKFLHKRKFDIDARLLHKYYQRYMSQRFKINELKRELKDMEYRFKYPGPNEHEPEEQTLF